MVAVAAATGWIVAREHVMETAVHLEARGCPSS